MHYTCLVIIHDPWYETGPGPRIEPKIGNHIGMLVTQVSVPQDGVVQIGVKPQGGDFNDFYPDVCVEGLEKDPF